MRYQPLVLVTTLILLLQATSSLARTWFVDQSGAGDFHVVQDALEVASEGDTVLIGPGRYEEFRDFDLPGFTAPALAGVGVDDITIIGTSQEEVVPGPSVPDFQGFGPIGIITAVGITSLRIENLTLENLRNGIYAVGRLEALNCMVRGCEVGMVLFTEMGADVVDCVFVDGTSIGVFGASSSRNIFVTRCSFRERATAISFAFAENCHVIGSVVHGGRAGIQFEGWSSGSVRNTSLTDVENIALNVITQSNVLLEDVEVSGGSTALYADIGSHVVGNGNRFMDTSFAAIVASSYATFAFRHNEIVPASGHLVRLRDFVLEEATVDLRENYWGTSDSEEIRELIIDGSDDEDIHATVSFEPFLRKPIAVRDTSFGRLKTLFRGH